MMQASCPVACTREVAQNIFVLRFISPAISRSARPGQFVNVRAGDGNDPLLRRPFSVYRTEGDAVEILFNIVGRGTALLSRKREGEAVDVLGPLGVPFTLDGKDFDTGILIGGGLGVAPLPMVTAGLQGAGKKVVTCLGARTGRMLVPAHLANVSIATDDGSTGERGTVVSLLRKMLDKEMPPHPRLYACGPTAMLRAVASAAKDYGLPCEVSLEGPMACGIGICQGCPVELAGGERTYALMCKDGPVFDIRRLKL